MHLIVKYALTLQICIYMYYKSSSKEPLLCDSFAPKFSDRYTEPAEYALYAKFKDLVINDKCETITITFHKFLSNNISTTHESRVATCPELCGTVLQTSLSVLHPAQVSRGTHLPFISKLDF
jgi:hypothetical protein